MPKDLGDVAAVDRYRSIPAWCTGDTVVVIGGGPSLTQADVCYARDKAFTLAVNDGYRMAPWCDWVHAGDYTWWLWHAGAGVLNLKCQRTTLDLSVPRPWADCLENTGVNGFDRRRWCLRTGHSSGYQAVCIAIHGGARRIILLGFDCKVSAEGKKHWFGNHPQESDTDYKRMIVAYSTLTTTLDERAIEVINCSPGSALKAFPQHDIQEVL